MNEIRPKQLLDLDPDLVEKQEQFFNIMEIRDQLKLTRSIHSHFGFFIYVDQFYNEKDKDKFVNTKELAYEKAEAMHVVLFGYRKYKSFDSYRIYRRKIEKG